MNKTRVSLALHNVFNDKGQQRATGIIYGGDPFLEFPIYGWATLTHADPPLRGRKRNLHRKAAVVLAHQWFQGWDGHGKEKTDRLLAPLLGYSDERAVRRVRAEAKKAIKGRYLFLHRSTRETDNFAILLDDISSVLFEYQGMRIIGPGWVWHYGKREAIYQNQWNMEVGTDSLEAAKWFPVLQQEIAQSRQSEGGQ